ncbi:hypothetical protein CIW48_15585 [Methylobacterium sp. P1-11]|uniref:hypothetical protein n=1 Tax=Methylobacterium sp. P1-11 TaxID=2024616 RepID=UPI0011ED14DF|nr:hypothetical protein [Methylobacterium sp. P1-11]KAA0122862.1 hypothetical protein CIW48_15585 [Methylobacterium sp. P1-11]
MSETEASREPAAAYWMLQYKSAVEEKARVRVEVASHERPAQIIATSPSKGEVQRLRAALARSAA